MFSRRRPSCRSTTGIHTDRRRTQLYHPDQVIDIANSLIRHVWKNTIDVEVGDIPTITYAEAIDRFGVDNPDLRFEMELFDFNAEGTAFPF